MSDIELECKRTQQLHAQMLEGLQCCRYRGTFSVLGSDSLDDIVELARIGPTRFLADNYVYDHYTTMAAPMISRTAIPRFLLPQTSWGLSTAVRPTTQGIAEVRRHRSSIAPKGRATSSVTIALQRQRALQHQKQFRSFAAGYGSALEIRRNFSATAPQWKDHHFDTLKFIQRLKEEGFTDEQAEGMMRVLGDVIEERCVAIYSPCKRLG